MNGSMNTTAVGGNRKRGRQFPLLTLAIALCISLLSACGANSPEKAELPEISVMPEEVATPEPSPEVATYAALGETVATDILEITLNRAELAIALENSIGADYWLAKEYNASADAQNPCVAAKGHTLVALEFTVANVDRGGYIDFGGWGMQYPAAWLSAEYKGHSIVSYDQSIHYSTGSIRNGKVEFTYSNSVNVLVPAGEVEVVRCYLDVPVEADSLDDEFKVTFYLPDSTGTTTEFTYTGGTAATARVVAAQEKQYEQEQQVWAEHMKDTLLGKKFVCNIKENGYKVFYEDGTVDTYENDNTLRNHGTWEMLDAETVRCATKSSYMDLYVSSRGSDVVLRNVSYTKIDIYYTAESLG